MPTNFEKQAILRLRANLYRDKKLFRFLFADALQFQSAPAPLFADESLGTKKRP